MKKTRNLLMRAETQTPEGIKNNIVALLPWITEAYELENPVLSYDNQNPKDRYKLVWVMEAHTKAGNSKTCFCFYPMKNKLLQRPYSMATPLNAPGETFPSRYGLMEVVELADSSLGLQITNVSTMA